MSSKTEKERDDNVKRGILDDSIFDEVIYTEPKEVKKSLESVLEDFERAVEENS